MHYIGHSMANHILSGLCMSLPWMAILGGSHEAAKEIRKSGFNVPNKHYQLLCHAFTIIRV